MIDRNGNQTKVMSPYGTTNLVITDDLGRQTTITHANSGAATPPPLDTITYDGAGGPQSPDT